MKSCAASWSIILSFVKHLPRVFLRWRFFFLYFSSFFVFHFIFSFSQIVCITEVCMILVWLHETRYLNAKPLYA